MLLVAGRCKTAMALSNFGRFLASIAQCGVVSVAPRIERSAINDRILACPLLMYVVAHIYVYSLANRNGRHDWRRLLP